MRLLPAAVGVFASLLVAACGGDVLRPIGGELLIDRDVVTFQDTWIGNPSIEVLRIQNASRAPLSLTLAVEGSFSAPARIELEGGEGREVELSFAPEAEGPHSGALTVSSERGGRSVRLAGNARRPPTCVADKPCLSSTFDPVSGTCISTALADGTSCGEDNACVTDAQCNDGVCVGIQTICDDGNACTIDACDPLLGCIQSDSTAACPQPTEPCKAAFCDPVTGCGVTDVVDGTSCGVRGCDRADVCFAGVCRNVPVPEGASCGGESPCQGEGTCVNKVCVQPDPTVLLPAWSYTVQQGSTLDFVGTADAFQNVYWTECTPIQCFGPGCSPCQIVSATRDGVIRWREPMIDAEGAAFAVSLMVAGDRVVSKIGRSFLEARRISDGTLLWSRDLEQDYAPVFAAQVPSPGDVSVLIGEMAYQAGTSQLLVPIEGYGTGAVDSHIGSRLLSLNIASGVAIWEAPLQGRQTSVVVDEHGRLFSSGSLASIASNPRNIFELRAWSLTGSVLWSTAAIEGRDLVVHDHVLVAGGRGAHNAMDGSELWANGSAMVAPTLLGGGRSYSLGWRPSSGLLDFMARFAISGQTDWIATFTDANWATDLVLTDRFSTLMLVMNLSLVGPSDRPWTLEEFDPLGQPTFSCVLPSGHVMYTGATLVPGRLVVLARSPSAPDTIYGFDVGRKLATSGWVTRRGNLARTGAPR